MKIKINSKNYKLSDEIRNEVEKKISKLSNFFSDDTSVTVMINQQKPKQFKVDVTVSMKHNLVKSEVIEKDEYTALDKAMDKIQTQILKHKEKFIKKGNDSIRYDKLNTLPQPDPIHFSVVKNKSYKLTPMSESEACFQLDLLEHSFYLFLNENTNKVSVVYKRNDGDYGLIEANV